MTAFCSIAPFVAIADGVTENTDEMPILAPVPVPADWAGFYAGLSYGQADGDLNFYSAPGVFDNGPYFADGNLKGIFAGYNFQHGNFVYGGELSKMFGDVQWETDGAYEDIIDLKARVGYAFGNALLYGTRGYSYSKFAETNRPLQSMSGPGYGIGVDYLIAERYLIGVEYYRRDLNGTLDDAPTFEMDNSGVDTRTIRFAMQF